MRDILGGIESTVLLNGLKVYNLQLERVNWQRIGIVVHSGALHDPVGKEGLMYLLPFYVFSRKGSSLVEARKFFIDNGGRFNLGKTDFFSTKFGFFLPRVRGKLIRGLNIFGNAFFLPLDPTEDEVERVKQIVLEKGFRKRSAITKTFSLEKHKNKILFKGLRLENLSGVDGFTDTIQAITVEDVARALDFHYSPTNMSLVAVGRLSMKELLEVISESSFWQDTRMKGARERRAVSQVFRFSLSVGKEKLFSLRERQSQERALLLFVRMPGATSIGLQKLLLVFAERILQIESAELMGKKEALIKNFGPVRQFSLYMEGDITQEALMRRIVERVFRIKKREFSLIKRTALLNYTINDLSGEDILRGLMEDIALLDRPETLSEKIRKVREVGFDDFRNFLKGLRNDFIVYSL